MKSFVIALATILVLDFMWLNLNNLYHKKLFTSVQKAPLNIRVIPALFVYLLIPFAIIYFAVSNAKSLKDAAMKGAILGLCMYGLYDLTNLSTLKGWTYEMATKDMLWGTTLCAAAAAAAYKFS